MSITCKLNYTEFSRGLQAKLRASKKDEADITNRAARDVCLKSIKYTPRAQAKGLGQELLQDGYLMRLVYAVYHPVGGQKKQKHLVPGLATSPAKPGATRIPGYTRTQMRELANRLLAHKRRSRGYIAAGWIKAAQAFGAALNRKVSNAGEAGKGYGKKATPSRLEALGANLATGAILVGPPALQQALDEVGLDMSAYAERKMAGNWNR